METNYMYLALVAMLTVAAVCGQTSPERNEVCSLPKILGNCRAMFPRYYFDAETGCCKRFTYGGCGANGNNFMTKRECRENCPELGEDCRRASRRRNGRGRQRGRGRKAQSRESAEP